MKTSTNYIVFKMYCIDNQLVAKNKGAKSIPPLSSLILLLADIGRNAEGSATKSGGMLSVYA